MKILVLSDASSPHTQRWCRGLRALGHEVALASFQEPGEGKVIRLKGQGKTRYLRAGKQVARLAGDHDAVIAHFLPSYGVAARASGRPFGLCLWGTDILAWPFRDALRFRAAWWVLSRARIVAVDSDAVRRILEMVFGYPRERIWVFPFGPEPDVFGVEKGDKEPGRIIFPRAMEPLYNLRQTLSVLGALADEGLRFKVVFTAGGSHKNLYLTHARTKAVPFEFKGWLPREDYLHEMARAHIYLSPALSDATPVSLLEAMALGALPVVSDLASAREWILDGVNGLLFDPTDPGDLARAAKRALQDEELAERARALNEDMIRRRGAWPENLRDFARALGDIKKLPDPRLTPGNKRDFWSYWRGTG